MSAIGKILLAAGAIVGVGAIVSAASASSSARRTSGTVRNRAIVRIRNLAHQPFPKQTSLPGAVALVPEGLTAPYRLVVYCRGIRTTVAEAVEPLLPYVPPNTLVLAPEFEANNPSEDPGTFANRGALDLFLNEVYASPEMAGYISVLGRPDAHGVVAHSGGYRPAGMILVDAARTTRITDLALLDAIYDLEKVFEAWAKTSECRHLSVVSRTDGTPGKNAKILAAALGAQTYDSPPLGGGLQGFFARRYAFATTDALHTEIPARYLRSILSAWGTP